MKVFVYFAVFAAVCCLCSAQQPRQQPRAKRNLFGGVSVGTGLGGFGSGFGHGVFDPFSVFNIFKGFPFFHPVPVFHPGMFDFSHFTPWYKGANVCPTTKTLNEHHPLDDLFDDFSMHSSSESCYGDDSKYVCMKRIHTDTGSKLQVTTYKCCAGYVRRDDGGPGCYAAMDHASPLHIPPLEKPTVLTSDVQLHKPTDLTTSIHSDGATGQTSPVQAGQTTVKTADSKIAIAVPIKTA